MTAFTKREAEHIWWDVIPYHERRQLSDYVSADEMTRTRKRRLRTSLYREAVRAQEDLGFRERIGAAPIRYLDKTISNCFHLQVIEETFPDASIVVLTRDPRANIASMIEGWAELNRFGKRALTPYIERTPGSTVSHWTYPAPPGWQEVLDRSLVEICAWSWKQHVRSILDFIGRTRLPVHRVTYEQFVASRDETVARLARELTPPLRYTEDVARAIAQAPLSRTTVTPPWPGKWRRFEREIGTVLPEVAGTAAQIGYDTD